MDHIKTTLIDHDSELILPPNVKIAIHLFIHTIKFEFPDKLAQIILYRSYTRGDFHQESDVDILVLTTDDSWNMKKRIIAIGFDIYPDIGVMVSAKVMTEEQFMVMKDFMFFRQVSKDGITVL
ncbi:MAG: nucleotidyltransferase domain-containing protein [Methanomicrobiales archaeon]|nr:nucleotidyltransferase domain-containing protein [Methanomicrobiales archaeon]